MTDDLLEVFLLLLCVWVLHHECVVAVVRDVFVRRQDVDILDADTDPDARVSVPEEVRLLVVVRDVVRGRLKVARVVQSLEEDVARSVCADRWKRESRS